MELWLKSNNAMLPTGDKYVMFSLSVWKYIPASNFARQWKLECDWMLQASAVWKHTFPPPFPIKAHYNAQYDVSVGITMTDLMHVTVPVCSWEDPACAPTPPHKDRGTRYRWAARLETATDPGKVAGGSKIVSQSRADGEGDGASKEDIIDGGGGGQAGG